MTDDTPNPRAFLEQFDPTARNVFAQFTHRMVRTYGDNLSAVLIYLVAHIGGREATAWQELEEQVRMRTYLAAIADDPKGCRTYIQSVIAYEALPEEEKRRIKAQRGQHYQQQTMAGQAATSAQLALLRKLGYDGPDQLTKLEASRLIDSRSQWRS